MTPLNTIIEEENKEFDGRFLQRPYEEGIVYAEGNQIKDFLTSAMQRAFEAGEREADAKWEREVEAMKTKVPDLSNPYYTPRNDKERELLRIGMEKIYAKNDALDTLLSKIRS